MDRDKVLKLKKKYFQINSGIHIITGGLGSGKTILLALLAYWDYLDKKPVYSNFRLHFPTARIPTPFEALVLSGIRQGSLYGDEAWIAGLDAREWQSGRSTVSGKLALRSRKRGLKVSITAQLWRMVEVRVREIADYYTICERRGKDSDLRSKIKATTLEVATGKVRKVKFKVGDFCHLYDTNEEMGA